LKEEYEDNDMESYINNIIGKVLELEQSQLYLERPHVVEDIQKIIKNEIKK